MSKDQTTSKRGSNQKGQADDEQHTEWIDAGINFILRLRRFSWDVGGLFLLAFAAISLLALIGHRSGAWEGGAWVIPWIDLLLGLFGLEGSIIFIVSLAFAGIVMLNHHREEIWGNIWKQVIVFEVAVFAFLALQSVVGGVSPEYAEQGTYGGKVGYGLAVLAGIILGTSGFSILLQKLLMFTITAAGLVYSFGLFGVVYGWLERSTRERRSAQVDIEHAPTVSVAPTTDAAESILPAANQQKKRRERLPAEFRKNFRVEEQEEASSEPPPRDDRLPPLELLSLEKATRPDERHINQTAGLIEKTLADFGISAKVVGFQIGPTVTQFAVEPGYRPKAGGEDEENGNRVRVSQISSLRRDLALALSAERLRIQAPVPGQPYIGIEVPNSRSYDVRLRPILENEAFYKVGAPLAIGLGRDVSGQVVAADLARMPHLLIAGTTGSGKSVCIAAITVCLVMNNTPEDLRLVMIDPKMVELVPFNGLPHLIGKVETDLERIATVLRWVVVEMENRYKKLEELRARDLDSYNRKARRRKEYEPLPRIVVLIDELADLMMSAAETTEAQLVRLAQMARATGIHLVVATQRPSTDVVTGLIKANFPARISFAVASGIDSRVILDNSGAESLLGRGDMLFLDPEAGAPIRSQGAMVTDQEIEKVITFWRKAWAESMEEAVPWEELIEHESVLADRDELVQKAIELIKETGKASASHLQRGLRVGYPRAARLVDELEDMGVLGPSQGGGRDRDILIDLDGNNDEDV